MLTRTTRFQVVAFVVIAIVGVVYVAIRYVGVDRWVGASGYTVKVDLASAGGIFPNAEVTYRGVAVGRVGDLRLTRDGIQVDANIESDDRIPADVEAVVTNRSVIGEQFLDLRPRRSGGPYLSDGSTIAQADTALPPPVEDLLLSADRFARSVPIGSLQTVVNEFYDATQGVGQDFQSLLTTTKGFFGRAEQSLPQTLDLIRTSRTVLSTQQNTSEAIKAFSTNLRLLGQQLRSSDGDLSRLFRDAPAGLDQANGLLTDIDGPLRGILSNLFVSSRVFYANRAGLREVYVNLPVAVTAGGSVITPRGINVGVVPTFFDPLPCTAGYGGTTTRSGLDTTGNPPLNLNASCTESPSTGRNVRGGQNAPGPR